MRRNIWDPGLDIWASDGSNGKFQQETPKDLWASVAHCISPAAFYRKHDTTCASEEENDPFGALVFQLAKYDNKEF